MFVRMKQNADNFLKEAEKIRKENESRQESAGSKPGSPSKRAAIESTGRPNAASTPEKDKNSVSSDAKKNDQAALPQKQSKDLTKKDDKSATTRTDAGNASEKTKAAKQESGNNVMFYGVAAAALGLGLYVGYRIYQGDSLEVLPLDVPVKPQV